MDEADILADSVPRRDIPTIRKKGIIKQKKPQNTQQQKLKEDQRKRRLTPEQQLQVKEAEKIANQEEPIDEDIQAYID